MIFAGLTGSGVLSLFIEGKIGNQDVGIMNSFIPFIAFFIVVLIDNNASYSKVSWIKLIKVYVQIQKITHLPLGAHLLTTFGSKQAPRRQEDGLELPLTD
jgi:hypothetical protein